MALFNTYGPGILGLVFLCWGLYQILRINKKNKIIKSGPNWPIVIGNVTGTKVKTEGGEGWSADTTIVTFRYSISGNEYTGKSEVLGASREDADNLAKQFSMERVITVHYNPQKPAECVTEYDRENHFIFGGCIWIIMGMICMIIVLFFPD